jgi:hypothetical protein
MCYLDWYRHMASHLGPTKQPFNLSLLIKGIIASIHPARSSSLYDPQRHTPHLIQATLHGSYSIIMFRAPHLHFSMSLVLVTLSNHNRRLSVHVFRRPVGSGVGLHLLTSSTNPCRPLDDTWVKSFQNPVTHKGFLPNKKHGQSCRKSI